jgi:hypothetical protein
MSEIVEHDRIILSWRDHDEEQKALRFERQQREIERERAAARKAEKKQPAAAHDLDELVAVIDERVRGWFDHYFDGLGKGNDHRGLYADEIAKGLAGIRDMLRGEFRHGITEAMDVIGAKLAALEDRPGKLPVARTWRQETVTYAGAVVCHDGASYQALRD